MNKTKVLEDVGKISDAIRLADEPAGEVKKNMKQINSSSQLRLYTYCERIKIIPEQQ
jgi:hypothetical protein